MLDDAAQAAEALEPSEVWSDAETLEGLEFEAPHSATEASEAIGTAEPASPQSPPHALQGIRYASSALAQGDYWDADDDRQFAGQVYPDPGAEEEPDSPAFGHDSPDEATVDMRVRSFYRVRSTPTAARTNSWRRWPMNCAIRWRPFAMRWRSCASPATTPLRSNAPRP